MKQKQAIRIGEHFSLGSVHASPKAVSGGLLHKIWRIETSEGIFAVKELNREIISRPGARNNYILSEEIAQAFARAGMPVIAALSGPTGPLLDIEGDTFLIFPWIDGITLSSSTVTSEQASQIGILLGQMHNQNLQHLQLPSPQFKPRSTQTWIDLTQRASLIEAFWSFELRRSLPQLVEWIALSNQSLPALTGAQVISHRDLDQKNVLWQDSHIPWLIDWEAAGRIHPTFELVDMSLNWSGVAAGKVDEAIFQNVVDSYRSTGASLHLSGRDALNASIGNWLGWLQYNVRRAFGELASDPEEQLLGAQEVLSTLQTLNHISSNLDLWSGWIDE